MAGVLKKKGEEKVSMVRAEQVRELVHPIRPMTVAADNIRNNHAENTRKSVQEAESNLTIAENTEPYKETVSSNFAKMLERLA